MNICEFTCWPLSSWVDDWLSTSWLAPTCDDSWTTNYWIISYSFCVPQVKWDIILINYPADSLNTYNWIILTESYLLISYCSYFSVPFCKVLPLPFVSGFYFCNLGDIWRFTLQLGLNSLNFFFLYIYIYKNWDHKTWTTVTVWTDLI